MIPALDISQYQGAWQNYPCDIVMIKMSGGDAGLYMDPDAATNYTDAKAVGKHVGGYHINGWTLGAVQEASWFYRAMSPVAENDVFAIDIEKSDVPVPANAPEYVLEQINYLESKGVAGGLVYMSLSTLNAFDWSAVLAKWALWLADWAVSPQATIPTTHVYVMQQYSDGPNYDHDEWFGTLAEFDAYGWHAPVSDPIATTPAPAPAPVPPTASVNVTPEPVVTTIVTGNPKPVSTSVITPISNPVTKTENTTNPVAVNIPKTTKQVSFLQRFITSLIALLKRMF